MIHHLISGGAFFSGLIMVAVAGAVAAFFRQWWARIAVAGGTLVGWGLALLSATPFSGWFWWPVGLLILAWLVVQSFAPETEKGLARAGGLAVALIALVAMLSELPRRSVPRIEGRFERLYIVGDSISAGLGGEGEWTWPAALAEEHGVEVVNLSVPGATAGSAVRQVQGVVGEGALVIVEIGGNDLLGRGSSAAEGFAADLEKLLTALRPRAGAVIMFELPLTPGRRRWGRVQRQLAARFEVEMIPKRIFARVLTGDGNTIDGLHLSNQGHRRLAAAVWEVVGGALKSGG